MGRPLNKRYFGSGPGQQIKVNARVGSAAVAGGYIVSQRSTKKFRVNAAGNIGVCKLVDKADVDLLENEMNITVLTDANTLDRVTKMYNRVAIVNNQKVRWNFSADLTDGAVQMPDPESGFDVTVAPVISITTHPVTQTISVVGDSATFTVVASVTENAELTYQWEYLVGDSSWVEISGATSATLEVTDSSPAYSDGNLFRVVVSADGAIDEVSNEAILSIE
jgi:hypothetical protein